MRASNLLSSICVLACLPVMGFTSARADATAPVQLRLFPAEYCAKPSSSQEDAVKKVRTIELSCIGPNSNDSPRDSALGKMFDSVFCGLSYSGRIDRYDVGGDCDYLELAYGLFRGTGKWPADFNVTPDELFAVEAYQGSSYIDINASLRDASNGKAQNPDLKFLTDTLASALGKLPRFDGGSLQHPRYLIRGINDDQWLPADARRKYTTAGTIFQDLSPGSAGYPSSSYSGRNLRLMIYARKRAVDMEAVNGCADRSQCGENEIIMQPGTWYKVISTRTFTSQDFVKLNPDSLCATEQCPPINVSVIKELSSPDEVSPDPSLPDYTDYKKAFSELHCHSAAGGDVKCDP